jgi:hypothetical protein
MDSNTLHIIFTMDFMPPGDRGPLHGPESWRQAEDTLRAFMDGIEAAGQTATLFVAPQCLKALGGILEEVGRQGGQLGLLCHPQLSNYQSYLGSYSFDRQREIIRHSVALWERQREDRPRTFRSGFFSANDYTYQVLCLEGFEQGSCSLPGRIDPEQCSLWQSAAPFPHHTDPLDRKLAGTMEFFEVPVTSDFEASGDPQAETYTPPHLRIEEPNINDHAEKVIRTHIEGMEGDQARGRSIVFVTHDAVPWGQSPNPHRERLHNLLSLLEDLCAKKGLEPTPATVKDLHASVDDGWHANGHTGSLDDLNERNE